jgi:N-hydroxyarylamine O-acetyltransferase
MTTPIDLEAYFTRIGYVGPRTASIDTLRALHLLHPQAIPFENLDPLLGRPVSIDTGAVERKLVGAQRGGYCFEHNMLFKRVLDALGFTTRGLAARVLWEVPAGVVLPRTHMLLAVEIDRATWLADVGFGGMTLTAPLSFEPGREQPTPHEPYRIDTHASGDFMLQVKLRGELKPVYRFTLDTQFEADYEMANHFVSTYPQSIFLHTLRVARVTPGSRYALMNRRLTVYGQDAQQRELATSQELREVLQSIFGIRLPESSEMASVDPFDALFARLAP